MASALVRVHSHICEGNRGELLKATFKPSITGVSGEDMTSEDLAACTLPAENAILPVSIQLRIDRKLVSASDLQRSGFLRAVVSFLKQYSARLKIKDVPDPEINKSRLEVPLLLEAFPSPLNRRFDRPARLESLAIFFHFAGSSQDVPDTGAADHRSSLLSDKLPPSYSSLVFRILLKSLARLAARYPLVFDARWIQYLEAQNDQLSGISKSLTKISRKVAQPDRMALLQRCIQRMEKPDQQVDTAASSAYPGLPTTSSNEPSTNLPDHSRSASVLLHDALFRLLLRAPKRKHALTKLLVDPPTAQVESTAKPAGDLHKVPVMEKLPESSGKDSCPNEEATTDSQLANDMLPWLYYPHQAHNTVQARQEEPEVQRVYDSHSPIVELDSLSSQASFHSPPPETYWQKRQALYPDLPQADYPRLGEAPSPAKHRRRLFRDSPTADATYWDDQTDALLCPFDDGYYSGLTPSEFTSYEDVDMYHDHDLPEQIEHMDILEDDEAHTPDFMDVDESFYDNIDTQMDHQLEDTALQDAESAMEQLLRV